LSQITPSYVNRSERAPSFYMGYLTNDDQSLPGVTGGIAISRSNVLQDLYFTTRENQTWTGIGYFVRSNPSNNLVAPVASLYRFQVTTSVKGYLQKPNAMFGLFSLAERNNLGAQNLQSVSKILDGVISFRVRAYDTNGMFLTPSYPPYTELTTSNIVVQAAGKAVQPEIGAYTFYSNAVPAYVEFEVGILEPKVLEQYNSIPVAAAQEKFLQKQAAHVHLFRQRVSVRNVDPSAYQ